MNFTLYDGVISIYYNNATAEIIKERKELRVKNGTIKETSAGDL